MLTGNTRTGRAALALLGMQRHSWEQGVAMQAFYEMGQMDAVVALARESVYRALPDGRVAMIGPADGATDPCSAGEALLAAVCATGDETLRAGAGALLRWTLEKAPRSPKGVLYHLTAGREFWADSFYMLPPYLAAAGHYDEALANLYGYWEALYDPEAGMMRHRWNEETRQFSNPAHWGTGNGWTLAALARIIPMLPDEYGSDRSRLAVMARDLANRVMLYMGEDGSYHNVIDDPATFREINLSQMLAYTLYRGMTDGWLDADCLPAAEKLRRLAEESVDAYGFVHDVCGAPYFDRPGFSPEAQAFHLLMENAAARFEACRKSENGAAAGALSVTL